MSVAFQWLIGLPVYHVIQLNLMRCMKVDFPCGSTGSIAWRNVQLMHVCERRQQEHSGLKEDPQAVSPAVPDNTVGSASPQDGERCCVNHFFTLTLHVYMPAIVQL